MPLNQILELLGGGLLLGANGRPDLDVTALEGKTVALYFSAHWCPPCRGFTPVLVATYEAMRKAGRSDFEFIFISSDKSENQFNEYRNSMPWLALPFSKREQKTALSKLFGINGIPALVTIAPDGTVINKSARGAATGDREGKHFPWMPQALGELGSGPPDSLGYSINDAPALCVFTESCDDAEQSEAHTVLAAAAEAAAAALKASGSAAPPPLLYFHASAGGGLADRVRELCGLGSAQEAAGPAMVILDVAQRLIVFDYFDRGDGYVMRLHTRTCHLLLTLLCVQDQGALYKSDATEITADTVKAFADAYLNGKRGLTRQQLKK
eukprot:19590-Heterococcus_DN1.PRE.1